MTLSRDRRTQSFRNDNYQRCTMIEVKAFNKKLKNTPHKNFVGAEIIINWFMNPRKNISTAEGFSCNYYDV